jgi:hypothetical protein
VGSWQLSFLTELVATSYVDFLPPGKGSQYAYSSLQLQVTGEGPPKAQVPASRLQPEIHITVEGVEAQHTTNREMVLHLKAEFKLQKKRIFVEEYWKESPHYVIFFRSLSYISGSLQSLLTSFPISEFSPLFTN